MLEILGDELGIFVNKYVQSLRQPAKTTDFLCKNCDTALIHVQGKRKDGKGEYDFFACPNKKCKATYPNTNGTPGTPKERPPLSEHKCRVCKKFLVKRSGIKGEFFGCSGFPKCKQTMTEEHTS